MKIAPIRRRACARCSRVLSSTEWSRHNCAGSGRHAVVSACMRRYQQLLAQGVLGAVVSACMRAFGSAPW